MTATPPDGGPPTVSGSPNGVRPHLPLRPLWLCRACGGPWPCATARLSLTHEYANNRTALRIYLGTLLHEADADLHRLNPHDAPKPHALFDRFLGWTPPHRPS